MVPYDNREFHHPALKQDYFHRRFATTYKNDTCFSLVLSTINGQDHMSFIAFSAEMENTREIITDKPGLHWSPSLSVAPSGRIYACWISKSRGYYKLIVKYKENGSWSSLPEIQQENAFYDPTIGEDGGGNIILVTGIGENNTINLCSMKLDGGTWSIPKLLSGNQRYSRRPVLVPGDDETAIVFWDGFDDTFDQDINVSWNCEEDIASGHNKKSNPVMGIYMTVIRNGLPMKSYLLSNFPHWQLSPTACRASDGRFCCAWIRNTDVERDGVISVKCDIMTTFVTLDGPLDSPLKASDLSLGLLPGKTYFGYTGLRRFPQLSTDTENLYLCYEAQKREEADWPNLQNGYFACRKFTGESWSDPLMLTEINSSHHLVTINDGLAKIVCKGMRDNTGFDLTRMDLSINNASALNLPVFDAWSRWQEITLPHERVSLSGYLAGFTQEKVELLWGELHCHSVDSGDAEGEVDELLLYARYKAGLQFSGITDNDVYLNNLFHNSLSASHDALIKNMSEDGEFIAFNGYEFTFHRWCEKLAENDIDPKMYNHRSIIFTAADQFIAHRCFEAGKDEESYYQSMKNTQALFNAHHQHFELFDSEHERNVEVASAWNLNIETDPYVQRELDAGKQFGFNGASDNHRFIPGMNGPITGLLTNCGFTRDNIIEALFKRRCFASAGARNLVILTVNKHYMGESFTSHEPEVSVKCILKYIFPEDKFSSAQIIHNGKIAMEFDLDQDSCHEFTLRLEPGANYIYLRAVSGKAINMHPHNIAEAFAGLFWTSPLFVDRV